MAKNIVLWVVALTMLVGIFTYLPTAYVKERCGQIETWFAEKQKNPEMYPGLELTESLKEACPNIQSDLGL